MGRWGSDLYQSDQALDAQAIIIDRLEREIAFLTTPEQVNNSSYWLTEMLGVVELILMFEDRNGASSVFLQQDTMVQRWRGAFLSVWDGDWREDDPYASLPLYHRPNDRQRQRSAMLELFDRLESIARIWMDIDQTATPLSYVLPHFSIHRWTDKNQLQRKSLPRFTSALIEYLAKDIIFWLSDEKRPEMLTFNAYEVWVAADKLALLCEAYEHTPLVTAPMVRIWREKTILIWKDFEAGDNIEWDEADPVYQNVMGRFDRLEALAEKYPSEQW